MISSTTLILATLVFNAASILGAPLPIRIRTAPEVVVRAAVGDPILPRVAVVDAQPVYKRSAEGTANRPRLAPEIDLRDTASPETVETRSDPLPEVDVIVRRYHRRALHDFYEKRSPEPEPSPAPSETQVETRETLEPEQYRRYPRRIYHDQYEKRSEPVEARSVEPEPAAIPAAREEPELHRRFPRRVYAEYYAKRSASTNDNLPREPAPEPAPEPAAEPVIVERDEPTRRFPRRSLAERYGKRQVEAPELPVNPPVVSASPTTTATSSPTVTTTSTTTTTTPNLPTHGVDLGSAIAAAIANAGSNNVQVVTGPNGEASTWSETKVEIKITSQGNTRKQEAAPPQGSPAPTPAANPGPSSTSPTSTTSSTTVTDTPSSSPLPSSSPSPSPSPSPTATGAEGASAAALLGELNGGEAPPPAASSSSSSLSPSPTGSAEIKPGDGLPTDLNSTTPPDASTTTPGTVTPRDVDEAQPLVKRTVPLSASLWATWNRRDVN